MITLATTDKRSKQRSSFTYTICTVFPQLIRALYAILNLIFSGNLMQFIMLMKILPVLNANYAHSFYVYRIRLRTTLKIPTGGELYACYTHSLLPTMLRREHLLEGKHFACACTRCSDPTELGTHMSSLKCNKCDNGIILPLDSLGTAI